YYHQDHLSNRMVTNSSGSVVAEMGHFPFGESWYNATNEKLYFTTYEYDSESSNHYARARYDTSRLGRLSSPDPIAGSKADPQSLNRYSYSLDDPANVTDPSGLCPTIIAGTGDTPENSPDLIEFAQYIGANIAFPLSNLNLRQGLEKDATGIPSAAGLNATNAALAASKNDPSGLSSVITFSAGAEYYQFASNSFQPANVAYVEPGSVDPITRTGTSGTFVYTGTGGKNDALNAITSIPDGANQMTLPCNTHSASCAFQTIQNTPPQVYLPYDLGTPCEHPKIFTANGPAAGTPLGGGGGAGGAGGGGDPSGNPFGSVDSGGPTGPGGGPGGWTYGCVIFGGKLVGCSWQWHSLK
ncbi:MAG TPA: RHS repeat-associated core domain-containing protein, partial [Candidatus Acidoferrum sp.]|nr:RHS repeat-associated core domain-containing protein [Candidatus Acidoferrum sp.]